MKRQARLRIGDLLVQSNKITQHDLDKALIHQQDRGGERLGRILVERKLTTEEELTSFLASQLNLQTVDLADHAIDRNVVAFISEEIARQYNVLALSRLKTDEVLVAMSDPSDIYALEVLDELLDDHYQVAVMGDAALAQAIDQVYKGRSITNLVSVVSNERPETDFELFSLLNDIARSDAPVARLLEAIFEESVESKASDIHIEPVATGVLIRQRIDGVLQEQAINDTKVAAPLTSKLKLLANLNISERRLPQDGRFSIGIKGRAFDVRLSTLPAEYGESVVLRLLDQSDAVRSLSQLGFTKLIEKDIAALIDQPQGLILVTGPTGSGKTTSLYSMIGALNTQERKIITVEDPVEYRIHRVTQVHVNEKIGLTFPRVLDSSLRQDPDVILVGEMRDFETASIGIRAAMTGHLVLSTMHTNDTVSAITRLVDLGVPYFLIATSLQGILAQRLVRKICIHCKTDYTPTEKEEMWLFKVTGKDCTTTGLKVGAGCKICHDTGYSGRIPIHELLVPSRAAMLCLQKGDVPGFSTCCHTDPNFSSLAKSGALLALEGRTSISAVIKMAGTSSFSLDMNNPEHASEHSE